MVYGQPLPLRFRRRRRGTHQLRERRVRRSLDPLPFPPAPFEPHPVLLEDAGAHPVPLCRAAIPPCRRRRSRNGTPEAVPLSVAPLPHVAVLRPRAACPFAPRPCPSPLPLPLVLVAVGQQSPPEAVLQGIPSTRPRRTSRRPRELARARRAACRFAMLRRRRCRLRTGTRRGRAACPFPVPEYLETPRTVQVPFPWRTAAVRGSAEEQEEEVFWDFFFGRRAKEPRLPSSPSYSSSPSAEVQHPFDLLPLLPGPDEGAVDRAGVYPLPVRGVVEPLALVVMRRRRSKRKKEKEVEKISKKSSEHRRRRAAEGRRASPSRSAARWRTRPRSMPPFS